MSFLGVGDEFNQIGWVDFGRERYLKNTSVNRSLSHLDVT